MPSRKPFLLIRTDSGRDIGIGHVMRCLAIAHEWTRRGGDVAFLSVNPSDGLSARLAHHGMTLSGVPGPAGGTDDAAFTAKRAGASPDSWLLIDGYAFGVDYFLESKRSQARLAIIDDGHISEIPTALDVVVNPNIDADISFYRCESPATRVMVGPSYALLRPEFRDVRRPARGASAERFRLLVTMGGADPDNLTPMIVDACGRLGACDVETVVILGPENPHRRDVEAAIGRSPAARARLEVAPDEHLPSLMAEADLAITAAGGTMWELLAVGTPMIAIHRDTMQKKTVEHLSSQRLIVAGMAAADCSAASISTIIRDATGDRGALAELAAMGRKIVDGHGPRRVVDDMTAS